MTFDTTEKSVQDGRPRELYTFETSYGTWQLTSSKEDETHGGILYVATPGLSRTNAATMPLGQEREMTVTLPSTHELAVALISNGIPPRLATLTVQRFHDPADTPHTIWRGPLAEITVDDESARIRVPLELDVVFDVKLPLRKASRLCPYSLYGPGCQVPKPGTGTTFIDTTTVLSIDGVQINLSSIAYADGDLVGGEIVRTATGESRTILAHVGTDIAIDVPFSALAVLDEVSYTRGCDGQVTTCRDKFGNVANFGGDPDLPEVNPMTAQPSRGRSVWDILKGWAG